MDRIPDRFLRPRSVAERRRPPTLIDVDLDPAQRNAVELQPGRALLVLGEAGHGKTTVALHRLAYLWNDARARSRAAPARAPRGAVIVPSEGLVRLIQPLIRRLGVDIEAQTYDRWAAGQARRALRDSRRRESESTRPLVARFKRDPAVRLGLAEIARRPPARLDDDPDAPMGRSRALVRRADLQQLFGDQTLLDEIARASGSITTRMVEEVAEHTRVQFSRTAEEEWEHVTDRRRLVAVDRRRLDEGTSADDAGTIDVEDYAVLFELERLRAAQLGRSARRPRDYDVIVLDEAQEMAPLELALIGRSLSPGGTMVVAGDLHQQTDATNVFLGWDATMRELGCTDHASVTLDVGYRCPPEIVATARQILRGAAPDAAQAIASTAPTGIAFRSESELTDSLGKEILDLRRRDPRASIAVLCQSPLTARRVAAALQAHVPARLVFDGRFLPRGPAQVTVGDEVKGLEFDFVVVPDANQIAYPDTPAARRALYVAVTRARQQVLFATVGPPTPLLAGVTFVAAAAERA